MSAITASADLVVGDDGLARCAWATQSADYVEYHDLEWGQAIRDDRALYERLVLESFQSGLSWITILRKRPAFRAAFEGFDPDVVAQFSNADIDRLLLDASIVRHRRKIEAARTNASALLNLWRFEGEGALTSRLTAAAEVTDRSRPPVMLSEIPASTPGSTALARDLKAIGFTFLGPTTLYAALQATGFVNDHLAQCHCRLTSRGATTRTDTE